MQYPTDNDCIKLFIDGEAEPQLVPKLLLQLSVRELHNSMVSLPSERVLKEARDAGDNIIIRDSTSRNILPTQLNKMSSQ